MTPGFFGFFSRGKKRRARPPEPSVAEHLAALPADTIVYHHYPCPDGGLDHVVISKDHGLFVIESGPEVGHVTVEDGRLFINGQPAPAERVIRRVLHHAVWFRRELQRKTGLDEWVMPMLVFPGACIRRSLPIQDVRIVNRRYLVRTILGQRATPGAAEVWKRLSG